MLVAAVALLLPGTAWGASPSPQVSASAPVEHQPPSPFKWRAVAPHLALSLTHGSKVSMLWMDPAFLRFRFIPGYTWPEHSPRTKADHDPTTWLGSMIAAFNGAYKLSDKAGGYYYRGKRVAPLRNGLASMVFYKDGSLQVGVWGVDVQMTPNVLAVRQNLKPIVRNGVSQTRASDRALTWGRTITKDPYTNRSALGVLADGTLVFLFAHAATPSMLAADLVAVGAQVAIALDMNGLWPTGYLYRHHGATIIGSKINPNIVRSPKIYYDTLNKDFVVVQSPQLQSPASAAATPSAGPG